MLESVTVLVFHVCVSQTGTAASAVTEISIFPSTCLFKFPFQLFQNTLNFFYFFNTKPSVCAHKYAPQRLVCAHVLVCVKRSRSGGNGCMYNASGVHFQLAEAPDAAETSISGCLFQLVLIYVCINIYTYFCLNFSEPNNGQPTMTCLSSYHGPLPKLSRLCSELPAWFCSWKSD